MEPLQVVAISLAVLGIGTGVWSAVIAIRALNRPIKHSQSFLELKADFAELLDDVEKLTHIVSKKANREQMRAARANGADPYAIKKGETPEQWKARMRAGVRSGDIKPPRFNG